MFKICVFIITLICTLTAAANVHRNATNTRRFPTTFSFGVATSSYQIEGAWNADGKGENIWDHLAQRNPNLVSDKSNGNVAANSYNLYKRDVEMLSELGVDHYTFSISWSRILPNGIATSTNQAGINYYNNLINELLAKNITPFVTMYHWELPQKLEDLNGWLSDDIPNWFGDYARILYRTFGDRVKKWITINDPKTHCKFGYGTGVHAPSVSMPGHGDYICGRNILLAHARAWHIYDSEFRSTQKGEVGIAIDGDWVMPSTNSSHDAAAVTDYNDFMFGQYMNPIFSSQGNYPQSMISRVNLSSSEQGYLESRLRVFSTQEINYIRGTADFLGLSHYSSYYVYRNSSLINLHTIPSMENDAYFGRYQNSTWPSTAASWIREYPQGLFNILVYVKNNYNISKIYITGNGMATPAGLHDDSRVQFHRNYLNAVLDAIDAGVNVQGYTVWSLMDNFAWNDGYTLKFGLYEVNMGHANRIRTTRKSALVYKEIIRTRTIDYTYNPEVPDGAASITACAFIVFLLSIVNLTGLC